MTRIHARQAPTVEGWKSDIDIEIGANGRIKSIGPHAGQADHALDLVLPAPVNLHSHSFQRAMAGLTEARGADPSDSFWTWRNLMYRFLERLTPDHVEAIAAQAFMEMAEAGFGAVAEFHYLHHGPKGQVYENPGELTDRIAAAAEMTGLGLTHLPVYYEFGGCDRRELQGGQRRFGNNEAQYCRLLEQARSTIAAGPRDWNVGVAPHSLRAVDNQGLSAVIELAREGPIHMHLAEQTAEVDELLAHTGRRPVEWLLEEHDVADNWCLIHCTQMTSDETNALARTGAVAGLCPITESSLGDGIFNGPGFLDAGGTLGIGSDSNIQISLVEELKTLEYSQRLRDRSRAVLATSDKSTGRRLFDAASMGGAQAAQRESGKIQVGRLADLCGLSTDNEWLCNRSGDFLVDSLIFSGNGDRCIRDVWSAGRHIVANGQHVAHQVVLEKFRQAITEIGRDL